MGSCNAPFPTPPKKSSDRLQELEQDGIVLRNLHRQKAPRVEYSLTSHRKTLTPILGLMAAWGERAEAVRLRLRKCLSPHTTYSLRGERNRKQTGESTALLATGHTGFTSGNLRSINARAQLP